MLDVGAWFFPGSALPYHLKCKALQVLRLWDHGDDGVVGGLGEGSDAAENAASIVGGGQDRILEKPGVHVMRTAESGQGAAGLQELE